jgi:hypothetical protein
VQAIAILYYSPRRCGFVSHPGSIGQWREGLLSLMGLSIQVVPVAAQTRGPYSGGLSRRRGCVGGAGALFPAGHPLPPTPLLRWSSRALCFPALGRPAKYVTTL